MALPQNSKGQIQAVARIGSAQPKIQAVSFCHMMMKLKFHQDKIV